MRNLAIIPARSGSKGIPDKNIKMLSGKPLMVYSIQAALDSGCFDTVMVSTDSDDYADVATKYGAEVPFLRSEKLSSDSASSWDMVLEVISGYERLGKNYDSFCLLQPTSPLRTSEDIKNAYDILLDRNAFSIVSMTELEHPLAWCGVLGDNDSLEAFISREGTGQRQVQGSYYRPNGAIYIAMIKEFLQDKFLYRAGSYAYIMPKERSVDIDTDFDLKFAEFLMREK